MSIRTAEQLSAFLADQLAWRKKELTTLKFRVEAAGAPINEVRVFLRAAVTLLYAHWEGFVKAAAAGYVEFVAFQRLPYRLLATNFVALAARRMLRAAKETSYIDAHLSVAEFFLGRLDEKSNLPYRDGVRTDGNLSAQRFRDIVVTLGLEYRDYETKAVLIDEKLLGPRNTIAHGEFLCVTREDFSELATEIVGMMDLFRNQIDNAVSLQSFRG